MKRNDFQTRIRRIFAEQLISKHKLQLNLSKNDSSDSVFELFSNEMLNQLNKKLTKQDEQLLKERNQNSPLIIQKKQLQKDIQDFHILNQRNDFKAIQQIIQRVEHMAMFNQKYDTSIQPQPVLLPTIQSVPTSSCSYWVSFKLEIEN
jgi:hypothetical protein